MTWEDRHPAEPIPDGLPPEVALIVNLALAAGFKIDPQPMVDALERRKARETATSQSQPERREALKQAAIASGKLKPDDNAGK